MRLRSLTVLSLCLVLMASACTPEGVTPTAAPAEPLDLSEFEPDPDWECFYLPGLVAVADVAHALEVLPDDINAEQVTAREILDLEEGDRAAEAIDGYVGFIRTGADPLLVSQALRSNDNPASPIHAMGLAGHWGFAPGTPPRPVELRRDPVDSTDRDAAYIAVVDSGIDDTALPGYMAGDNVFYEPQDVEVVPAGDNAASHGTFVADVIRRLSPEHKISIARAQPIPPNAYVTRPQTHDPVPFEVPSEIHVAYAIERIRDRNHPEIAALNLSLGAYVCDPSDEALLLTLMSTLEDWDADLGAPIIAAAGNETLNVPFWPAMMPIVTGVQATDGSQGVVWSGGVPVPGPTGPWVNELAPGVDIIGLRGGGSEDDPLLVAWSGSSFASAVATGLITRGDSIVPDHPSVRGLSYVDPGQGPVTNP